MNRTTLARRYAPLAAALAVQLVIIVTAPSTAQKGTALARGGASTPPGVSNTGDTSHCVGGREYDPAIAYWAPPCVPGTPGGTFPNNGGSTGQGVTGDSITIVDYVTNYGAEVNAILQAEGQLVTADDAKPFDAAMQNFINKRYVLFGRKVKIITYQGKCQSVPPDLNCLLPEMNSIVDTYHPYIVQWLTTLCSAC